MKKLLILSAFLTLFFTACTTQKSAVSGYDDVYNTSPSDNTTSVKKAATPHLSNEDLSSPQAPAQNSTKSNAAWYDEYNTKSVNADSTAPSASQSYYGDYANSQNPDDGDVNVYVGSSWSPYFWGPAISFSFGWGYGYPYYGGYYPYYWDYPYWYYPYYSYGYYGWGGYWNGYWDGYYDGRYGYYPYSTGYYYGPRTMASGNHGYYNDRDSWSRTYDQTASTRSSREVTPRRETRSGGSSAMYNSRDSRTATRDLRNTRTTTDNINRNTGNNLNNQRRDPASGTYKYTRTRTATPPIQRDSRTANFTRNDRSFQNQQRQPNPKYVRPDQQRTVNPRTTEAQNYSSPAYRQPKSSQEYVNPGNRTNPGTTNQRRTVSPTPGGRNYSTPSNSGGQRFSSPSNSNSRTYSTPSRSSSQDYSSPSKSSSPSYSSPSRSSSPSYSAPSRSSGGSTGSGSSGGGGRRR